MSRQCPYLDTIGRQRARTVTSFQRLPMPVFSLITERNVLDFDFEKLCSVSLSHLNVYACLVCGKYFQGRGQNTHAYTHSVSEGHRYEKHGLHKVQRSLENVLCSIFRVYLNLETKKFYCLPDNYEIIDPSLSDILYVLNPTFTRAMMKVTEF